MDSNLFSIADAKVSLSEAVEREKREVGYHAGALDALLAALQVISMVGQPKQKEDKKWQPTTR